MIQHTGMHLSTPEDLYRVRANISTLHILTGLTGTARLNVEQDVSWICAVLQLYSRHWHIIAHGLGFTETEISTVEASYASRTDHPYSYLQAMLFRWLQWFPGDIRGSTYYPTLEYLQKALDEGVPHYKLHMAERCAQLMKYLEQELRQAITHLTSSLGKGMWCHI